MGGIGSGKSAVAAEFAKLGCGVVDADRLAHEALCRDDVRQCVVGLFGEDVLDGDGGVDHKRLAEVVFGDPEKLSQLTGVIHPLVLERMEEILADYGGDSTVLAIVLDVPLLVEVGWHERCDRLIFVDCDRDRRVERAANKGFGPKNEVAIRENFQISLDNKKKLADNTIDNNSGLSALFKQVADIFSHIVENK